MKKINMAAVSAVAICLSPIVAQAAPIQPVPEPSTVIAGALCLVPLGVGLVRSFRKNRR